MAKSRKFIGFTKRIRKSNNGNKPNFDYDDAETLTTNIEKIPLTELDEEIDKKDINQKSELKEEKLEKYDDVILEDPDLNNINRVNIIRNDATEKDFKNSRVEKDSKELYDANKLSEKKIIHNIKVDARNNSIYKTARKKVVEFDELIQDELQKIKDEDKKIERIIDYDYIFREKTGNKKTEKFKDYDNVNKFLDDLHSKNLSDLEIKIAIEKFLVNKKIKSHQISKEHHKDMVSKLEQDKKMWTKQLDIVDNVEKKENKSYDLDSLLDNKEPIKKGPYMDIKKIDGTIDTTNKYEGNKKKNLDIEELRKKEIRNKKIKQKEARILKNEFRELEKKAHDFIKFYDQAKEYIETKERNLRDMEDSLKEKAKYFDMNNQEEEKHSKNKKSEIYQGQNYLDTLERDLNKSKTNEVNEEIEINDANYITKLNKKEKK